MYCRDTTRLFVILVLAPTLTLLISNCSSDSVSHKRVVTVAAFADEEFRKYDQWELVIQNNIKEVSNLYDSLFGIEFRISSLNEWESNDNAEDFSDLFYSLKAFSSPCTTDLVIGFSLQAPTSEEKKGKNNLEWGLSSLFGSELVVRFGLLQLLDDEQIKITLLHEIAHLFGAFHCSDSTTIMGVSLNYYEPRLVFDNETIRLIRLMKDFPFCKGVLCLESDMHYLISDIYEDGHLQGEQNPIAASLDSKAHEYIELGLLDSAFIMFHFAIPHYDTTSSASLSQLAFALWSTSMADSALIVAEKAVIIDPTDKNARNNLAMHYLDEKNTSQALFHLDKALEIDPEYTFALYGIAIAHLQLSDTSAAVDWLKDLLSIDSLNSKARNLLDSIQSF